MTDIWDEKPLIHVGVDDSDLYSKWYPRDQMDAWLEKLHDEWNEEKEWYHSAKQTLDEISKENLKLRELLHKTRTTINEILEAKE